MLERTTERVATTLAASLGEAYEWYTLGWSWDDIAKQLEITSGEAEEEARRHAEATGKQWPPVRARKELAYKLRQQGLSWEDAAEHMGMSRNSRNVAMGHAKDYAELTGSPWPVPVPPKPEKPPKPRAKRVRVRVPKPKKPPRPLDTKGEHAYRVRSEGHTWDQTRDLCGFRTTKATVTSTRRWAKRNGMEWPPQVETAKVKQSVDDVDDRLEHIEDKGERCYRLYETTLLSWAQVAEIVGFESGKGFSGWNYAKRWARKHEQPWPPERGVQCAHGQDLPTIDAVGDRP